MLIFEAEQLTAFARASFVDRVLRALSDLQMGTQVRLEADAMRTEVLRQLEAAGGHGFVEERDCARWVLAAWCLGSDFHRKIASVAELLARPDVGPAYKSLALELMVRAVFVALAGSSRSAL